MGNNLSAAAITGLIVGAGGALLGAVIAFLLKSAGKKTSAALLGLAGGVMLSTFLFDMLPHLMEGAGILPLLPGVALGALVMFAVTKLAPHKDAADLDAEDAANLRSGNLVRTGLLLAAGMAIHNLPQGIAIGGGVVSGVAAALAILLLLHNIPEGMAMALPLKIGGVPCGRILLIALAAALPTVAGALIGAAVSGISETFVGASIAFAGGAMVYLTLRELIPQALGINKSPSTILSIGGGVLLGLAVVLLTHHEY
jgi:ZIP family zinc transporter